MVANPVNICEQCSLTTLSSHLCVSCKHIHQHLCITFQNSPTLATLLLGGRWYQRCPFLWKIRIAQYLRNGITCMAIALIRKKETHHSITNLIAMHCWMLQQDLPQYPAAILFNSYFFKEPSFKNLACTRSCTSYEYQSYSSVEINWQCSGHSASEVAYVCSIPKCEIMKRFLPQDFMTPQDMTHRTMSFARQI